MQINKIRSITAQSSKRKFKKSARDKVYDEIIRRTKVDKQFNDNGMTEVGMKLIKHADRFQICGLPVITFKCKDCAKIYFGFGRCESRICPECAAKYANRIRRRQSKIIKDLSPTKYKKHCFLTVTRKSSSKEITRNDIIETFNAFKKLMAKFYPKNRGCGGFAVIEIGKNNNLHIHAIVYGYYIPQNTLSNQWLRYTGDSSVVFIKMIHNTRQCLNYLLKYLSKPPSFDNPDRLVSYLIAITGTRRVRTFGVFYNYKLIERISFECIHCGGDIKFGKIITKFDINEEMISFADAFKIGRYN